MYYEVKLYYSQTILCWLVGKSSLVFFFSTFYLVKRFNRLCESLVSWKSYWPVGTKSFEVAFRMHFYGFLKRLSITFSIRGFAIVF